MRRGLLPYRAMLAADIRNVGRDPMLAWVPLLPFFLALLMRWGVPALTDHLQRWAGLDLTPYYPLLASFFLLLAPSVAGMLIGFLLLDERDDRTLTAMLVTPIPAERYLLYRVAVLGLLGLAMTLLTYPLLGLVPLPWPDLLAAALLSALTAPLLALFLAAFAPNKVAGFALMKLQNALGMIPIAGYFLPQPWRLMAGVIPTYWPLQVFWLAAEGRPYAGAWGAGLLVNLLAIALLLRRFRQVMSE